MRYLPVSLLADGPINEKDGSIVFFQRVKGFDFNKVRVRMRKFPITVFSQITPHDGELLIQSA